MKNDFLYPLRKIHGYLYEMKQFFKMRNEYKYIFKENRKSVFLLMTPEHGNIGDQAIAIAEKKFLEKSGLNVIEITSAQLEVMKASRKLRTLDGFPILINGGGNLGTLWPNVENLQREIILNNPHSIIMFLPNTIYYEKTDLGMLEFEKSIKIYNKHKHLFLYAREKYSYEIMKNVYKNAKLMPDMVFSLDPYRKMIMRKGCLLCLRQDIEKTRSADEEQQIRKQVESIFLSDVKHTDMVVNHNIKPNEREKMVKEKMDEFCGVELVITDRLHGMILCAITGTPCIVIDSKSPKVRGCYTWIKHLEYIRFADKPTQIINEYNKIPHKDFKYDNSIFEMYFDDLRADILAQLN